MSKPLPNRSERIRYLQTVAVAVAYSACLFALYYVLPLGLSYGGPVWWSVLTIAVVFLGVLTSEIVSVVRHHEPMRRAVVSLAVLFPLFITLYARLYLTMSVSDSATFGHAMTKTESLYLTMTILSTVGFGDITPKTDPGRIVVMTQMVASVALLASGVRLLLHFGTRAAKRQQ